MVFAASVASDFFKGVLQGTPPGTVYALIALGFVLTYKTSGVFNLAFGAQAYVSAVAYYRTHTAWDWPIVPSLVLERLIFRHLRTAPAVAKLVVALGLTLALPNLFDLAVNFQSVGGVTPV